MKIFGFELRNHLLAENKELTEKIKELEEKNKSLRARMQGMADTANVTYAECRKRIKERDDEIEKLKSKIDILYRYYDMDKEPTQEVKTAMRINDRIHDLELDNIELRSELKAIYRNDGRSIRLPDDADVIFRRRF